MGPGGSSVSPLTQASWHLPPGGPLGRPPGQPCQPQHSLLFYLGKPGQAAPLGPRRPGSGPGLTHQSLVAKFISLCPPQPLGPSQGMPAPLKPRGYLFPGAGLCPGPAHYFQPGTDGRFPNPAAASPVAKRMGGCPVTRRVKPQGASRG